MLFRSASTLSLTALLWALTWPTTHALAVLFDDSGRPVDIGPAGSRSQRLIQDGRIAPVLHGVWRSLGYGFLLDLRGSEPDFYITAGSMCWHADLRESDYIKATIQAFAPVTHDRVLITAGASGTLYRYRRLRSMPDACLQDRLPTNVRVFDALWMAIQDRYAFLSLRHVDWDERRVVYRPKAEAAQNDTELYRVLSETITGFRDGHLSLSATLNGRAERFRELRPEALAVLRRLRADAGGRFDTAAWEEWLRSDQAAAAEVISGPVHHGANGRLLWGITTQSIGYVRLDMMQDYGTGSLDGDAELIGRELDTALEFMKRTDAIVIDVTRNRGGDDRIGRIIASRFADRKRLAYTKHVRGGPVQPFYVSPARHLFLGPVYLMTSCLTEVPPRCSRWRCALSRMSYTSGNRRPGHYRTCFLHRYQMAGCLLCRMKST